MVARTAFTQLHYSVGLLILCTLVMLLVYQVPVVMIASANSLIRYLALGSLVIMKKASVSNASPAKRAIASPNRL